MNNSLIEYYGKKVKIIDINEKEWQGYIKVFTPAIENDDNLETIAITTGINGLTEFKSKEIKHIEIIE